ncbi:hypothetical protein, partial [Aphanothece microscopica]|uniref:hypothetical protein n=1 Tax=Aphanothece microscopica TaxID=1049561 RepID=UPI0039850E28
EEALRLRAADPAVDAALRQVFRASALGQAPRPRVPAVAVGAYRSTDLRHDLGASLRSLPARKAAFRVQGRTPAEAASGAPIYRAPRLPVPLADYMVRIAPEALISGAQDLPDNTITFFEERRSFVESLLAGANHALNDELRWRGFATDLRGTPLARFWNRGAPPADRTRDDIGPITGWTGPLGRQPDPANPDGTRRLVVVIKGDVVRKLDQPILRIDLCATPDWTDTPQTSRYPVFSGKLRADTAYYGFDVARAAILARDRIDRAFFVILEPRGRLRFGLDVGHRAARDRRAQGSPRGAVATWDDLGW